jgi:tyrosine-specific transport protein
MSDARECGSFSFLFILSFFLICYILISKTNRMNYHGVRLLSVFMLVIHCGNIYSWSFPIGANMKGKKATLHTSYLISSNPYRINTFRSSTNLNNDVKDDLKNKGKMWNSFIKKYRRKNEGVKEQMNSNPTATPPMSVQNGIGIIAGTAIGGGFLALPSVTAPIGYGPTSVGLIFSWLFLLFSSYAFIEAAGLAADVRSHRKLCNGETFNIDGRKSTISSIIMEAFGKRWGIVAGVAFACQLFAVMTIQIVKGASIISQISQMSYAAACFVPPIIAASFAYFTEPEVVEGGNSALTGMMIGGFLLLCISTISIGSNVLNVPEKSFPFTRNNWASLLPNTKSTWSIPVLMKLLAWGEAMPLLTERMVEATSRNGANPESIEARTKAQRKARTTTTLGSSIPLILCLIWAAISTLLISPLSASDPISYLLSLGISISVPVGLLSFGAIGTTLLGSFLAMGHFASDILIAFTGRGVNVSKLTMCAKLLTVLVPCVCAYLGPGLYLPLLAFAGAYPTTLIYGLAPSLAAIVLRKRARNQMIDESRVTPNLLPGGMKSLVCLSITSVGIVVSCTSLALQSILLLMSKE